MNTETTLPAEKVAPCVKCGHSDGVDSNGWCLHNRPYNHAPATSLCGCKCEFQPTPASATKEQDDDADILDDERVGKELRRWQDAIRDKLIDLGAPDWMIDGAGCDSGDPLDFTLAEIGQGVGYFIDQLDELKKVQP